MTSPSAGLTGLTRAYLAILAARVLFLVAMFVIRGSGPLSTVADVVGLVVGLLWLRRAWARVPEPCRRAYDGRRVEPDEALWKLFIPVYGVYWLFIANIGLCGAVERHLQRGGARSTEVPSTLALVACLVQLVPVINIILSPFLWALFMARVDASQAEADRLDADARAPEPVSLRRVALLVVGVIIGYSAVLIFVFLAVWQFLNPGVPAFGPR